MANWFSSMNNVECNKAVTQCSSGSFLIRPSRRASSGVVVKYALVINLQGVANKIPIEHVQTSDGAMCFKFAGGTQLTFPSLDALVAHYRETGPISIGGHSLMLGEPAVRSPANGTDASVNGTDASVNGTDSSLNGTDPARQPAIYMAQSQSNTGSTNATGSTDATAAALSQQSNATVYAVPWPEDGGSSAGLAVYEEPSADQPDIYIAQQLANGTDPALNGTDPDPSLPLAASYSPLSSTAAQYGGLSSNDADTSGYENMGASVYSALTPPLSLSDANNHEYENVVQRTILEPDNVP
jgi:hypothetical protein